MYNYVHVLCALLSLLNSSLPPISTLTASIWTCIIIAYNDMLVVAPEAITINKLKDYRKLLMAISGTL